MSEHLFFLDPATVPQDDISNSILIGSDLDKLIVHSILGVYLSGRLSILYLRRKVLLQKQILKVLKRVYMNPSLSIHLQHMAYVTEKAADVTRKSLADVRNTEERRVPPLAVRGTSAGKQVCSSGMQQDGEDDRINSESLQEILEDAWNEAMSAKKQTGSGAGPSNKGSNGVLIWKQTYEDSHLIQLKYQGSQ